MWPQIDSYLENGHVINVFKPGYADTEKNEAYHWRSPISKAIRLTKSQLIDRRYNETAFQLNFE